MKPTEDTINKVKALIRDPKWPAVADMVEHYCVEISNNSPVRDSEYETLKTLFIQEGKIQGVREFYQRLNENI